MAEWSAAPHVVVVCSCSPGHAIPFLQFSRRLAAAGIVTSFVSTDRHVRELESLVGSKDLTAQGVPLRLLGLGDNRSHLSHTQWSQQLRDREEQLKAIRLLEEVVRDVSSPESWQLRGVQPAAPPVCVLLSMFVPWAQEAAKNLQMEIHLLYTSPATLLSSGIKALHLHQEGILPVTRETRDMIVSDIPGVPPTRVLDLPDPHHNAVVYEFFKHFILSFQKADLILVNTFYDLEKPVLDALRNEVIGTPDLQAKSILDIGPLLPESYVNDDKTDGNMQQGLEERDPCILWLNTRPPNSVLYVSFGSTATHSAPQLVELALGLEASGCSFLWIVRPPGAPITSEASGTPESITEFLPPGFEERIKDRGMCYSGWAPQIQVLKHPAIGGFLSHCGWNSTLETICAGVPMLTWPKIAEQHLIRRMVVDSLKVAIELKENAYTKEELESDVVRPIESFSKEEIESKVRCLMQEAESQVVRQNIQKLRAKSREVGAPGGSSCRNFEAYVRHLHYSTDILVASQPQLLVQENDKI